MPALPALEESELRAFANGLPHLVFVTDTLGAMTFANERACQYLGRNLPEALGERVDALLAMDDENASAWRECLLDSGSWSSRLQVAAPSGVARWFLGRAQPIRSASITPMFVTTLTDIDDQIRAEQNVRFLSDAGRVLSATLRSDAIARRAVHLGAEYFSDWCAYFTFEGKEIRMVAVVHRNPEMTDALNRLRKAYPLRTSELYRTVRREQHTLVVNDIDAAFMRENAEDERHFAMLRQLDVRAVMLVPVKMHGSAIGVINFLRGPRIGNFSRDDVSLAEAFAERISAAMRNAGQYEREHRVAVSLQRSLLPEFLPSLPGVRFASTYRPSAAEAMVGGDWYDAFALADGSIGVSIGDVTGHGLEAAATMGKMREIFRTTAIEETRPSEVMRRANRTLMLAEQNRLVTALFGVIDVQRHRFSYALAGHPPPILLRDGEARELPTYGDVPLGLDSNATFDTCACTLVPGDRLALYTDGLIESHRDLVEGIDRLRRVLAADSSGPLDDIPVDGIVDAALDGKQHDDVALLLVSFTGRPQVHARDVFAAVAASAAPARNFVRRFLEKTPLPRASADDVLGAAGEAIVNSIEHAYANGAGEFTVRAQRYANEIVVEIEDNGLWRGAHHPVTADLYAERGRGLAIIQALVKTSTIERTQRGTRVTLRARTAA